jgi:hypothetical protein
MMEVYCVEFSGVGEDASWCGGWGVQGNDAKARMKWCRGDHGLLVGSIGSREGQNYCIEES